VKNVLLEQKNKNYEINDTLSKIKCIMQHVLINAMKERIKNTSLKSKD
jgi:metal-sulfur cluster biosynthetic enzyme